MATGSTNADMLALAGAGEAEGSWLCATRQDAGRGRQGRDWRSPPGNFHGSTLVRIRPGDPPAPSLSFVAAVALDEAVRGFAPHDVPLSLKWPNDLMLGGAKLAGILLERSGDAVVIGIGANLAHAPDLPDRPTASLADAGIRIAPAAFVSPLVNAFAAWLARWREEGLASVLACWRERAHPIGTALTVRTPAGDPVTGGFDGLDDGGALRLRLAGGGVRVIHAGDVFPA